jgi:hypothetical protein
MGWGRKNARRKRPNPKGHGKRDTVLEKTFVAIDPQLKERWDTRQTLRQNYVALGLMVDPNSVHPQQAAKDPIELVVPEGSGPREEYLTLPEIINCRAMLDKHARDYLAMWRDIKLNRYQHTRKKLQTMCELYLREYAERDPLFKSRHLL